MKVKVIIILIGIFTIQFISSCCKGFEYYDFTTMDVVFLSDTVGQDSSFEIELSASDLFYLSMSVSDLGFAHTLAFSCDEGREGMKHPFENIEITSNNVFNNEYSANENLFQLFEIEEFKGMGEFEYKKLSDVKLEKLQGEFMRLRLKQRPTGSQIHNFTFKFTKSNKEEIIVETGEITWL
ncbi:MAG TPA: hypothetical protein VK169_01365 [Saprospiraceae bacterium]|nr:hypothetical protein [Saprospiraceae bacterium]